MTRRFILYIAVFNLLVATAAVPGLVAEVTRTLPKVLFRILSPVAAPPMVIVVYTFGAMRHYVLPGLQGGTTFIVVLLILCCVLYYGLLFVVFLPVGLSRGADLRLPVRWRIPWVVFAVVVVIIHVLLVIAGIIRWW